MPMNRGAPGIRAGASSFGKPRVAWAEHGARLRRKANPRIAHPKCLSHPIQSFQRIVNISSDLEFVVFRDSLGEWRWRLMNQSRNAVLAFGATSFKTCEECVNAVYLVMGAHSASIRDGCSPEGAGVRFKSEGGTRPRVR